MTQDGRNSSQAKRYVAREDSGFLTIHFHQTGETLTLNDTGRLVYVLLEMGEDVGTIAGVLAIVTGRSHQATTDEIRRFSSDLQSFGVAVDPRSEAACKCERESPLVKRLQDIGDASRPCPSYSMPKRACKGLPSGIGGVGKPSGGGLRHQGKEA